MSTVLRRPAEAAPQRMGVLAKLPVFLNLAGRRTVVAGGTAPAAWKAELLAAAGACVQVYAADLGPEMEQLLDRGASAGSLTHFPRPWSGDVFKGAAIALADTETMAEAQAFYCAARAAGVPVNVIDKPEFCEFQFGSIVNRSPVVIGISTDGAAPILGQAIRRRIETLLPPTLADWGRLAKSVRNAVSARLKPGAQRRTFWERFADKAFGPAPSADDLSGIDSLIGAAAEDVARSAGRVTLVGAGPGDADLMTLKAVRALQSADIILYDDLVSSEVLELARREAKRMMVGKRGGRESCAQRDINDLMVGLARQGKHVVRLKCGDPMIFGRAGEEIDRLEREGIVATVIPGITSASAMASALGVSLTHRDHAHSVRFVTGHARSGALPDDLDWDGLADPATTVIVYMGGRTIASLAARLIERGLDPSTPLVGMSNVARADQHTTVDLLGNVAVSGLTGWSHSSPILIGIGAVFASVVARQRSAESETTDLPVVLTA